MNNPRQHDRGLLACDFVAEIAETLVALAAGLLASACNIAPAAMEAELGRRAGRWSGQLQAGAKSYRASQTKGR